MGFNPKHSYDAVSSRNCLSGKDGTILDGEGNLLCTVESFQAQVNVSTATVQPLGSALQGAFLTGYAVTLTITQYVVEDDQFIQDLFRFFDDGRHAPHWIFQSVLYGYDGSEQRMIFRDCVPEGQIDLANWTIGDVIKRSWNLHCNSVPELQKLLSYS